MRFLRSIARKVFCIAIAVILLMAGYNIVQRTTHPLEYTELVNRYSAEYSVAPEMVMAIIKCESSFNKDARSSAGARGLMQLTEETFYDVRKMVDDGDQYTYETHWNDAETNIKYGVKYISYLLNMFNNDETAALAAYNAGMGHVQNWMGEDDVLQVSEIKFEETQNYVKNVRKAQKMYKKLYYREEN